ncbi:MAG: hypothetical protein LV481_16805 [Methylacidiphilales bacterium]|nr:hypothetical protein [Candidatus Methylacidiphilales bacterium]
MPHYVILSPFESPILYALFGLRWSSSVICILISLYFYRSKKEVWWLLVIGAFALPLISEVITRLSYGLPLLPYGLRTIKQTYRGIPNVVHVAVNVTWNSWECSMPPLMAIALGWAYLADRKRRTDGPTTT